jgi:hypothetical protein
MEAIVERSVEFFSEGVTLRGQVTLPALSDTALPGVVMCHGFGCTAAMDFPEHAARLAAEGYAVLRFDYRHWGSSEGEPRNVLVPMREVDDVRNALTFLEMQPEVDPQRLAIWGASFGGAVAIYAAAIDARVRAVAATVPVTNGRRWIESVNTQFDWQRILDAVEYDRHARISSGESEFVPFSKFRAADPSPSAAAWVERHAAHLGERTTNWRSLEAILEFAADEIAALISPRALLIVAAPRDTIVPWEQAELAYRQAKEPKRLVGLDSSVAHFDVYLDPILGVVMEEVVSWFNTYLEPLAGQMMRVSESPALLGA